VANENTACRHGSLWCYCRHNIRQFREHDNTHGHDPLMGRPKYGPARPSRKGQKQK
jgi:hypothetical protein